MTICQGNDFGIIPDTQFYMAFLIKKNILYIYTDGSSYQKPRKGGMGIRYIFLDNEGNEVRLDNPQFGNFGATNNQMELKAVVEALRQIEKQNIPIYYNLVTVLTDSRYVTDNVDNAKYYWPKNSWLTSSGRPVENTDLWKHLIKEIKKTKVRIEFKWVKGHSKDSDNKAVDRMAKSSAKSVHKTINRPLNEIKLRRKLSGEKTKVGSVEMKGQKIKIHIISEEYMRVQKLSKYRYEVVSPRSEFYGNVDLIFSSIHYLRAGHYYLVKLNDITKNPRIEKILRELSDSEKEFIRKRSEKAKLSSKNKTLSK